MAGLSNCRTYYSMSIIEERLSYQIKEGDGAIRMANGFSEKYKEHDLEITPEDIITENFEIFQHISPDPYDIDDDEHKSLAAGPNDDIKLVTIKTSGYKIQKYKVCDVKKDYLEFSLNGRKYGIKGEISLDGEFNGDLLIATGFDDVAKGFVGFRINMNANVTHKLGDEFDLSKIAKSGSARAEFGFIYGGEFAGKSHIGYHTIASTDDNETHTPYSIGTNVKSLRAVVNTEELDTKSSKLGASKPDLEFNGYTDYHSSDDTNYLNFGGGAYVSAELDIPVGVPLFIVRVELNGEISATINVKLKTFEIKHSTPDIDIQPVGKPFKRYIKPTRRIIDGDLIEPKKILPFSNQQIIIKKEISNL